MRLVWWVVKTSVTLPLFVMLGVLEGLLSGIALVCVAAGGGGSCGHHE
jgi:hypothetical protein